MAKERPLSGKDISMGVGLDNMSPETVVAYAESLSIHIPIYLKKYLEANPKLTPEKKRHIKDLEDKLAYALKLANNGKQQK